MLKRQKTMSRGLQRNNIFLYNLVYENRNTLKISKLRTISEK